MANQPVDHEANLRTEYECIHNTRFNITRIMIGWRNILIGGAVALVPISAFASGKFGWWVGWWIGWGFGLVLPLVWLHIDKRIDRDIVRLYPRLLELEQRLGMRFYSTYIIHNLNESISNARELKRDLLCNNVINYDLLMELVRKNPEDFVGTRGRLINRLIVVAYSVVGLTVGLIRSANMGWTNKYN